MADKVKWSYLAGIVDGEGCISCSKAWIVQRNEVNLQRPVDEQRRYWQYQLYIQVTNTNLVLMKWLVETFGGEYHQTYKEDVEKNHKARYEWQPKSGNHRKNILLGILPYLLLKREQAVLALQYIGLGYGKQQEREEILQTMQTLNAKGISPTTNTLNVSAEIAE